MSQLLEQITSGDPHKIWESSCAIATLRDTQELDHLAAHLPEIEQKTKGIDLGGALFPNREHLKFALRKLRYHQSKAGCLCRLYPDRLMFNPAREAETGNIHILETMPGNGYNDCYRCQCTLCQTIFQVEEGEYHYTWWKWKIAK